VVNSSRVRQGWFWVLKNTLNRATARLAYSKHGPFAVIRHVGRKSGKVYETPLILARLGDDFVAELTYGEDVAWYRNVVAAGHCTVIVHGQEYAIVGIEPLDTAIGLHAFGFPAEALLRLMHRSHFRRLVSAARP
jgi:hypothetical protein